MGRGGWKSGLGVAMVAVFVSACGLIADEEPYYKQSERSVGEQCSRTQAFFSDTLGVTDAEIRWEDYDSGAAVGISNLCVVWRDVIVLAGSTDVWTLQKGQTARTHVTDDPLFRPLPGYGHDVWAKRSSDSTRFAVVVGRWQGDLTVNTGRALTAAGPLEMTAELERQSVEFLIDLTEYIGS